MPQGKLSTFLGRVKGDPFALLNMQKGKVQVQEIQFNHEIIIPPDCFFSYRLFLPKFDTLYMDVEVLEGAEIDLLLTNEYNFTKYIKIDDFIYIVSGSILKIKKINNVFISQEDSMYHIILDNTCYPSNGAIPNFDINGGNVRVRISARSHQPLQMDLQAPMRLRN